jgi:hypothetical protein
MSNYHRKAEFWGAAIAGGVLVALPTAALAVAAQGFARAAPEPEAA